jgi:hypothetical protein
MPARRAAALLVFAAAVACAKRAVPDQQATSCAYERIAIVSNNWTQSIDAYAQVSNQSTPIILGTVRRGGRDEFVLPPGTTYTYVRSSERMPGNMQYAVPPNDRVQIRYRCRG